MRWFLKDSDRRLVCSQLASKCEFHSAVRRCLLGEPKPGRRQAVKAEAAKRGRDSASLYGLTPVRFTVAGSKRPQASSDRI
jgi:hypothetical protein